jgi:NADH dehydrogenase
MKKIVVVGAGFGGIACALELDKKFARSKDVSITLVDKQDYQLFYPNLYEVATSPEELTNIRDLKRSITVPVKEILRGSGVQFLRGEVQSIDEKNQKLNLNGRVRTYDYLVTALGSTSNFFNTPGAAENALTLMSVSDALRIRNKIDFLLETHRLDVTKQNLRVVVVGGGFSGVEFAGELQGFLEFAAWKNNFPREKIETLIIEGAPRVLPGLDPAVSKVALQRLHRLGVRVLLSTMVMGVEPYFVNFKNGEKFEYDCLVWTAGVKAKTIPFAGEMQKDRTDRLMTDACLRLSGSETIFAVGDQACVMGKDGRPMPGTIRQALHQASYVADTIARKIRNQKTRPYECKSFGQIIPIGGKWAILKSGRLFIVGWLAYFIAWLVHLNYFSYILGAWRAIKLGLFEYSLYRKND